MAAIRSISDVVEQCEVTGDTVPLVAALVEREQEASDVLRIIGAQFGMFPEIVAEALAEVGLGNPLSQEERAIIHHQYVALMQRLYDEQHGGGTDAPGV